MPSSISRGTLPQNFLDSVTPGLRLPTPEPQYFFAKMAMAGRLNLAALAPTWGAPAAATTTTTAAPTVKAPLTTAPAGAAPPAAGGPKTDYEKHQALLAAGQTVAADIYAQTHAHSIEASRPAGA